MQCLGAACLGALSPGLLLPPSPAADNDWRVPAGHRCLHLPVRLLSLRLVGEWAGSRGLGEGGLALGGRLPGLCGPGLCGPCSLRSAGRPPAAPRRTLTACRPPAPDAGVLLLLLLLWLLTTASRPHLFLGDRGRSIPAHDQPSPPLAPPPTRRATWAAASCWACPRCSRSTTTACSTLSKSAWTGTWRTTM